MAHSWQWLLVLLLPHDSPPPSPPPLLQHVGRMGHRAVDGQSHVTVWGPQTFGGGCLWHKQALTATLTNNTHGYGKWSYLYRLKPPQQPGDVAEMARGGRQRRRRDEEKKTKLFLTTQKVSASSQPSFNRSTVTLPKRHFSLFVSRLPATSCCHNTQTAGWWKVTGWAHAYTFLCDGGKKNLEKRHCTALASGKSSPPSRL